jgi:hypothetical protein
MLFGCASSKQKLQIISEAKYKSKSICITNPFVYLQTFDIGRRYFDEENQMKMVEFITSEAKDSLSKQFQVSTTVNQIDSEYFEYGNQLYYYMMRIDNDKKWSTIEMPALVKEEINKSDCDLNLLIFNLAFYRTKANMARGVAGSVASGILTLGNGTIIPNKAMSKMYIAIYSKEKERIIYFDNEEDSDMPIEEKNAKKQIRTLLEDFLDAPKSLPVELDNK